MLPHVLVGSYVAGMPAEKADNIPGTLLVIVSNLSTIISLLIRGGCQADTKWVY
jgi:hypothetical protein